ncbi:MAG TPA: cytochrome C oxidase subunit IV family protein [Candidatus Cryosericum sp.]|nr:cytochrome C oxidase subunit IV family protein [Candidatus Cryosericum sp.]
MTHHEAEHKEPRYGMVWVGLLVLTLVELWVAQCGMPKIGIVISLCALALVKAGMVAAYFMHLKFEKYALILIVLSPLLLSAILYVGLMPDSTTHTHWLPPQP